MKYVVGFLFDDDQVVLIQKRRPEWQRGKWNGVGGKVEDGETYLQAMQREFREEAYPGEIDWSPFLTMTFPETDAEIVFFRAFDNNAVMDCMTLTDETVARHETWTLPNVIPNLKWIVPLAEQAGKYEHIYVISKGQA